MADLFPELVEGSIYQFDDMTSTHPDGMSHINKFFKKPRVRYIRIIKRNPKWIDVETLDENMQIVDRRIHSYMYLYIDKTFTITGLREYSDTLRGLAASVLRSTGQVPPDGSVERDIYNRAGSRKRKTRKTKRRTTKPFRSRRD